jgi:hypothetical protein
MIAVWLEGNKIRLLGLPVYCCWDVKTPSPLSDEASARISSCKESN